MYAAIQQIKDAFDKADLKNGVDQVGNNWVLKAGINGKASTYMFLFIKTEESGNDVAVRIFNLVRYPNGPTDQAYETLNRLQAKYRHIRFVLQDDGNVNVEYDFPTCYKNIGQGAIEILVRLSSVLDDCYPELMRSVWN